MYAPNHKILYFVQQGVPTSDILKEMDQFLDDIGLGEKRNSKVETLSGGMKRKLSVAIGSVLYKIWFVFHAVRSPRSNDYVACGSELQS